MTLILVTGGTGDLGSKLVERFVAKGETVRVLSRRAPPTEATTEWAQGDMETGAGLGEAVKGADVVVHAAIGGGPEVLRFGEIAKTWQEARGKTRPIVNVPLMGAVAKGFNEKYNCTPEHAEGKITWREWLDGKYSQRIGSE